jgi:uncharacterized protein YodC (DUF2158 family)
VCSSDLACVPRLGNTRCPTGQFCVATDLDRGMCGTATMEMEPANNNANATTPMVDASSAVAIQGSLTFADVDCVAVTVPAMGRIYASATSPSGLCPGVNEDPAIDVYQDSTDGPRLIGSDVNSGVFNCPRFDGFSTEANFAWARNLAAGRYFVCIRNSATGRAPIPAYVLSVRTGT